MNGKCISFFFMVIAVAFLSHGNAQVPQTADTDGVLPQGAVVSINPLSLASFIPTEITKEIVPYLHNLESGVSVGGGYFSGTMNVEGRIVIGSPSALIFCPQAHFGVRCFPLKNRANRVIPLGIGGSVRLWDTWYTHSGIHFINIAPHPHISYLMLKKNIFMDVRLGWDFAVATASNLEHSSPRAGLTGFPPVLAMYVGCSL